MLVLSVDPGASVEINLGGEVCRIVNGGDKRTRLCFEAPSNVVILRDKLVDRSAASGPKTVDAVKVQDV